MKPPKFGTKANAQSKMSDLGPKLDVIACGIADELISGETTLRGELPIQDKCNILKTLSAYYSMVNKVEVPEELGGAFDKYRKGVAAADSAGGGSSRDSADAGRAAGANANASATASFDLNVVPFSAARSGASGDAEED